MLSEREVSAAIGSPAYGPDGEKIGTVEHFFVDDRTGAPTWAAVTTGLFGTRHSIVPAVDAAYVDGGLRVPVTKDAVKAAPHLTGDHLDPSDEAELRRHYGLDTALPATPEVAPRTDPGQAVVSEPDTTETPVVSPPPPPPAAAPTARRRGSHRASHRSSRGRRDGAQRGAAAGLHRAAWPRPGRGWSSTW